jgi:hypothetical protein
MSHGGSSAWSVRLRGRRVTSRVGGDPGPVVEQKPMTVRADDGGPRRWKTGEATAWRTVEVKRGRQGDVDKRYAHFYRRAQGAKW